MALKFTRRQIGYLALAVVLLALLVYSFWPTPVEVEAAPAARGRLQVTINEDGKTRIRERYMVSAPLAGRLMRITLEPGDAVAAGKTVLAVIEPGDPALLNERERAEARARLKAAESALDVAKRKAAQAQTTFDLAQTELTRAEGLRAARSLSALEYDQAVHKARVSGDDLKSATFAIDIARFEVEIARAALIRSGPDSPGERDEFRLEIKAPADGRVLRVLQKSATIVTPGTALLELGDPSDLEAEIDVLSSDGVKIKPGQRVIFEHWGGPEPLEGRVRLVEPAAFLKISALGIEEQRVNAIVDFVDPLAKRARLGDAFRVEARIVIWEEENVLKVPTGALFRHEDRWAVFKIDEGRARLTPVEIGMSNGIETEIRGGVVESDLLLLHPSDQVKDGARVTVRKGTQVEK